eukprot:GHVU01225165.1.p1 GENE.GHVU01225165.1~~GHVU01225165.1.p1  ORF type:complete len:169 (+),score=19.17 GHVU01225165.1:2-508(+)
MLTRNSSFVLIFACAKGANSFRLGRLPPVATVDRPSVWRGNFHRNFASTQMADDQSDTIFGKILAGEVPCKKVYENDEVLAFHDISPQAPTHIVVIPKVRDGLRKLSDAQARHKEVLGALMLAVAEISRQEKISDFRVVVNNGEKACQAVWHLHLHILAGRPLKWPPG